MRVHRWLRSTGFFLLIPSLKSMPDPEHSAEAIRVHLQPLHPLLQQGELSPESKVMLLT